MNPILRNVAGTTRAVLLIGLLSASLCGLARAQTFQTLQSWPVATYRPLTELRKGTDGNFYGMTDANSLVPGSGCIYRVTPQGALTILHAFGYDLNTGPGLIQASDGFFYGMTQTGSTNGTNNDGTFFRIGMDGSFATLLNFSSTVASYPHGTLVEGSDGNLYGTSSNGNGTVFKLTKGGQFSLLAALSAATGTAPLGRLVIGADGNFYGTTNAGGTNGRGTIFKVTSAGALTVLFNFPASGAGNAQSGLTTGNDGNFYGTANNVFYRITPQGGFAALYTFVSATGYLPTSDLVLGSDGFFYGTTIRGATNGQGGVYRMSSAGAYTQVRDFDDATYSGSFASVIEGEPGMLYGVTEGDYGPGRGAVFKVTTGGTLTVLNDFRSGGKIPSGPLVEGDGGNLFSTVTDEGNSGGVYKLDSSGTVTTLEDFSYFDTIGLATGGLIKGVDGLLYGLSEGSSGNDGVAYRLPQTGGNATVVKTFAAYIDGEIPKGRLVQAGDGNFYGVTFRAGYNPGTVFKLTPSGTLTKIFEFAVGASGQYPNGTLTLGSDGKLYGTAREGGSGAIGTIFRVMPGAAPTFTTVVNFNGTNGRTPVDVLVSAPDGNLYGTTLNGGTGNGGTLFKLTTAGVHTVIANFGAAGASHPRGSPAISAAGDFYGVTSDGGAAGVGGVYRVTAGGVLTIVYSFAGTGPRVPMGGLTFGPDGLLYGTTTAGGTNKLGTAFKITTAGTITHVQHFDYRTGNATLGEMFRASSGILYGLNQAGGIGGAGTVFQVSLPPIASTTTGTSTPIRSAALNGTVIPNGTATTAFFEYGLTTAYGTTTALQSVGTGGTAVAFTQAISGLTPHAIYHFRVRATNPGGTGFGNDATFTVANTPPTAPNGTAAAVSGAQRTVTIPFPSRDADGDNVAITSATGSANITVNSFTATSVTFTPASNFSGDAAFTYTVSDGFGGTATGTISVNVTLTPPPTGGTFAVMPNTGVRQGDSLTLTAAGWSDPDLPLTYQFFLDASALNTAGAAASLNIGAPAAGTYTLKVRVTDSSGSFTDATQPLSVVAFTPIESWRFANFNSYANTGNAADSADWDHDGILNVMEFAFGTDPKSSASGPGPLQYTGTFAGGGTIAATGQPIARSESITDGVDFRALFVRRVDSLAAGLTYTPELSTDLATWQASVATPLVLADNGAFQIVSVPYPFFIGGKKARYFRIEVSLAP